MNFYLKSIFILLSITLIIGCSNKEENNEQNNSPASTEVQSEMVKKGIINVESIDLNSDGKVYECPMDWNVLSDKSGDCPICGMNLKEFTIIEVKSNLEKYGYEYKK